MYFVGAWFKDLQTLRVGISHYVIW